MGIVSFGVSLVLSRFVGSFFFRRGFKLLESFEVV